MADLDVDKQNDKDRMGNHLPSLHWHDESLVGKVTKRDVENREDRVHILHGQSRVRNHARSHRVHSHHIRSDVCSHVLNDDQVRGQSDQHRVRSHDRGRYLHVCNDDLGEDPDSDLRMEADHGNLE